MAHLFRCGRNVLTKQLRVGESSFFYPSRVTGGSPFNSVEEKFEKKPRVLGTSLVSLIPLVPLIVVGFYM